MKILIVFILLVLLSFSVVASPEIKWMYEEENKGGALAFIDSIDNHYLEGIKQIKFYNNTQNIYWGYFSLSGVIWVDVTDYDYKEILLNEIAHWNVYKLEGYLSFCNLHHYDCFDAMYSAIK